MPDDQLPVVLPDLRGQDLVPRGVSPLAAATDWVNVECPSAAARPSGTPTPWTRSSTRPGTCPVLLARLHRGPFEAAAVRRWAPVDLYVGGVEHAILHLLYAGSSPRSCTTWACSTSPSRSPALINQGQVINHGKAMSKSLGNGVDLGEQIAAVRGGRDPADDDLRQPAGGRHRLGRHEPGGHGQVPGPGLADRRRRGRRRPAPRGRRARLGWSGGGAELRKVTHRTIDEVTRQVEAYHLNVAVARLMELVSATRRAIDAGPGRAADPAVREAAEVLAVLLSLFAPVHRRGVLGDCSGHKPSVADGLARRRPGPAGPGDGHLRRPGQRQGPGPAGGPAGHHRGRAARAGPGRSRSRPDAGRPQVSRVIVRPPKLVNIVAA